MAPPQPLPMPVIVGVPRSGTTLLRLMLDAHPQLAIPPETFFLKKLFDLDQQVEGLRDRFFETVTSFWAWGTFQIKDSDFHAALTQIEPFTVTEGIRCFYRLWADRFGKSRWGDKTVTYTRHLQAVEALLPEAHFIHLIRDGRDVALALTAFKERGMRVPCGESIEARATYWMNSIRTAREQAQSCRHYREVRYEQLIFNTTPVLQEICEFIDLPYDPLMHEYHRTADDRLREVTAPGNRVGVSEENWMSLFTYTSKPPEKSRVGRWQHDMDREAVKRFEAVAGEFLQSLGYELSDTPIAPSLAPPIPEEKHPLNLADIRQRLEQSRDRLNTIRAELSLI